MSSRKNRSHDVTAPDPADQLHRSLANNEAAAKLLHDQRMSFVLCLFTTAGTAGLAVVAATELSVVSVTVAVAVQAVPISLWREYRDFRRHGYVHQSITADAQQKRSRCQRAPTSRWRR